MKHVLATIIRVICGVLVAILYWPMVLCGNIITMPIQIPWIIKTRRSTGKVIDKVIERGNFNNRMELVKEIKNEVPDMSSKLVCELQAGILEHSDKNGEPSMFVCLIKALGHNYIDILTEIFDI